MENVRDVIIIGSGPSGWTAGIYAARAFLKPLILAGEKSGGQLMFTTEVENFPGFENGILGPELMGTMRRQAVRFGAEVIEKNVTKADFSNTPFVIEAGKQTYRAKTVIVSTGAESIRLNVPGEDRLLGRGVATCAVCDAPFYKDKTTFVIGGGDAAIEDAMALTKHAKTVTLIVRKDKLRASKIMQEKILHNPKVMVWWNASVQEVKGENKLELIVVSQDGKVKEVPADGLFLAIGHRPMTDIFAGQLTLDEKGYIVTRLGMGRQSLALAQQNLDEKGLLLYPTMTSVRGVFAAGDVVDFRYRQAVTAAGYGTMAALDAEWYLERGDSL